jgi:hypothetical protein
MCTHLEVVLHFVQAAVQAAELVDVLLVFQTHFYLGLVLGRSSAPKSRRLWRCGGQVGCGPPGKGVRREHEGKIRIWTRCLTGSVRAK